MGILADSSKAARDDVELLRGAGSAAKAANKISATH